MLAATGVLASGAAEVAGAVRRRKASVTSPGRLQVAGALALPFALAPSHWREGRHLGAFFAASGTLPVKLTELLAAGLAAVALLNSRPAPAPAPALATQLAGA